MPQLLKFAFAAVLVALISACSSPTVKEEAAPEFAAEGLHAVKSSGFAEAFVLPSAELSSYRSVNIEALDLSGTEVTNTAAQGTVRRNWELSPEQAQSLEQAWAERMDRAFGDYDLEGTGDKVLRISSALTKVQPGTGSIGTRGVAGGQQPPGVAGEIVDISGEFRLYDQGSGDLLAVIRDTRRISGQQWPRNATADISSLFASWSGLLHSRVAGRLSSRAVVSVDCRPWAAGRFQNCGVACMSC